MSGTDEWLLRSRKQQGSHKGCPASRSHPHPRVCSQLPGMRWRELGRHSRGRGKGKWLDPSQMGRRVSLGRQPELVSGRGQVGSRQVYLLNLHSLGSGQAICSGHPQVLARL